MFSKEQHKVSNRKKIFDQHVEQPEQIEQFYFACRKIEFALIFKDILAFLIDSLHFFISAFSNARRSRCLFLCFYSGIFKLTIEKFQTFPSNSRAVRSS